MQTQDLSQPMNRYISALADAERLQLLAQLIEAPCSLARLSATTGLPPADITRHLSSLVELGLVETSVEQEIQTYTFKAKTMETMIKAQLNSQKTPVATPWDGMPDEARRRTLSLANPAGILEYIPTQPKKLLPILEHVSGSFEKDREYSEKEVNTLLQKFTRDTSTLRRFLVENGYLDRTRDGARYWRK